MRRYSFWKICIWHNKNQIVKSIAGIWSDYSFCIPAIFMPTKAKVAGMCLLATICPAYCEINGNTAMQKFLKTMFSITVFAGIVLIAAGAVSLI